MEVYERVWGFGLKDIDKQAVLWHGTSDKTTPILHRVENEGHFSLLRNRSKDILTQLLPE
jgi:hypothetical protein